MPYNNNIPQPTDQLSVSQGQILINFQALSPWGNGYGVFQFIANPGAVAAGMTIYSNTGPVSMQQELFLQRNTGSGALITNYTFTEATLAAPGWTRLPSGMMMKWGLANPIGAGGFNVMLNTIGPAYAAAFSVSLAPTAGVPNSIFVNTFNAANLVLVSVPVGGGAYWMTIGY